MMSRQKPRKRSKRNPEHGTLRRQTASILAARFYSELKVNNGEGCYQADIYHDEDCVGLAYRSMALCGCRPLIEVRRVS